MTGQYTGRVYPRKTKESVFRYLQEVDKSFPVDTKHMGIKAKIIYPFLKNGWIEPIETASRMRNLRKD